MPVGITLGDVQVLYNTVSTYSIETLSFCNIGTVNHKDFWDIMNKYPQLKDDFRQEILQNPYDNERQYFMDICRKHIKYLNTAEEDVLKKLYYESRQEFYEPNQELFLFGDVCKYIYIIISGVIDIVISDGTHKEVLDILCKGSLIGVNYVLR